MYIDGYDIPAGVSLMIMIHEIHHDPEQFPDPDKFDPERFLVVDPNRHPFAYAAFSAGPRNCIGESLDKFCSTTYVCEFYKTR